MRNNFGSGSFWRTRACPIAILVPSMTPFHNSCVVSYEVCRCFFCHNLSSWSPRILESNNANQSHFRLRFDRVQHFGRKVLQFFLFNVKYRWRIYQNKWPWNGKFITTSWILCKINTKNNTNSIKLSITV